MNAGTLLLLLAVVLPVILYLIQPLGRRAPRLSVPDEHLSTLLAERDRVLRSLQELDFDYTLGKIPAEEYPRQRAELLKKGAAILKELDEHGAGRERSARLQAAVSGEAPAPVESDDRIESLIAARRAARRGSKSGGFCPQCGKPVLNTDRFCPHCGKPTR